MVTRCVVTVVLDAGVVGGLTNVLGIGLLGVVVSRSDEVPGDGLGVPTVCTGGAECGVLLIIGLAGVCGEAAV